MERPEPWQIELTEALWQAQQPINFYPDYAPFVEQVAAFVGQPARRIVVGQGIEGLIRDLVMLCCEPGDAVAYTWPTCAMFDIYARVFQAAPARIVIDPEKPFGADDLLVQLPPNTRLLILPNPGQPVDHCFSPDAMRTIATECLWRDIVLAIDEAYYGFGAETCLPLVDEFDNVVVLRTFSKAFGAAGIRVGFAIGQGRVIKPLDAVRASGEIAGPSLTAASVLMRQWPAVARGIAAVCEGRDWLRRKLMEDGHLVRGKYANHVLIDMEFPSYATEVAANLLERGVHVRTNAEPLDRYLMVTCGSVGLMQRFYEEFTEAL